MTEIKNFLYSLAWILDEKWGKCWNWMLGFESTIPWSYQNCWPNSDATHIALTFQIQRSSYNLPWHLILGCSNIGDFLSRRDGQNTIIKKSMLMKCLTNDFLSVVTPPGELQLPIWKDSIYGCSESWGHELLFVTPWQTFYPRGWNVDDFWWNTK